VRKWRCAYVRDTCWVRVRVISACLQACVSGGVHMYVTLVGCRYSCLWLCVCAVFWVRMYVCSGCFQVCAGNCLKLCAVDVWAL